jgi:Xaa-Pro aminopeptidase
MRLLKDQEEINSIKSALEATRKAHLAAMAFASPGRSEGEVQTLMEFIFQNQGAHGYAYDSIVASGDNANILHYTENTASLEDGDLLLIDAGSEHDLYASDITRTFPVNGEFSEPQKIIYNLVLEAQKKSLEAISPEATLKTLNDAATEVLVQGLIDLKILKGPLKEALESQEYKEQYWPHSIGHWLGLDVHDIAPHLYEEDNSEVCFRPGMVFTVEPGLYLPKDDESLPEEFRGIGVRIEDNILITENGYENLSSHIPKEVSEVEEACGDDYRKFLSL